METLDEQKVESRLTADQVLKIGIEGCMQSCKISHITK